MDRMASPATETPSSPAGSGARSGGESPDAESRVLRRAETCFASVPTAVAGARRFVRTTALNWKLGAECADTSELLVSELVTNSVQVLARDSDTGLVRQGPSVKVELLLMRRSIVIRVHDGCGEPPRICGKGPDAETGRGLLLVDALSSEWGHDRQRGGGKVVWCVLSTLPESRAR